MTIMQCEWCEEPATYRVATRGYARFACSDTRHRAKTDKLVFLDLGDRSRTTMINPTGFSNSGRVLGASDV